MKLHRGADRPGECRLEVAEKLNEILIRSPSGCAQQSRWLSIAIKRWR
ncbi:hypothetical protein ACFMPD_11590 [Sedimentitalea sp. HM32M-2]